MKHTTKVKVSSLLLTVYPDDGKENSEEISIHLQKEKTQGLSRQDIALLCSPTAIPTPASITAPSQPVPSLPTPSLSPVSTPPAPSPPTSSHPPVSTQAATVPPIPVITASGKKIGLARAAAARAT